MLEELEIHNLGPIRSALIAPAGGMTAITGETGAGKSMLLSAIRLISGGPSDGGRVSVGASEAWAQGVFEVASSPAAVAAAHEAGFEPEDGELFLSRKFLPPALPAACCLVVVCLVPYWVDRSGAGDDSWSGRPVAYRVFDAAT